MCLRRIAAVLLLIPLVTLALPPALAAQAVLTEGTAARGELRNGDLKLDDDTYADLWRFNGGEGQRVRITMHSGSAQLLYFQFSCSEMQASLFTSVVRVFSLLSVWHSIRLHRFNRTFFPITTKAF